MPPTADVNPSPDLAAELALARGEAARAAAERDRLRAELEALRAEHRRACDDLVRASDRESELVERHATVLRLREATDRAALFQAIQEVVINVVGSEELAVYELAGGALRLEHAFGLHPSPPPTRPLDEGPLGQVARTGRPLLARAADAGRELTACVPLLAGDEVLGLVTIHRMLDHKPALGRSDAEILALVSHHGGATLRYLRLARGA